MCLRKLSWNVASGSHDGSPTDLTTWCVQRYRRLLVHCEKLGSTLQVYKLWLRSRLAHLDFDVMPAAAAASATVSALAAADAAADLEEKNEKESEANESDPISLLPDSRAKHEAELVMLFARHDEDGDGRMKVREFCRLISAVDESFSSISAMKMFKAADINQDGSLDVKEFLNWLLLPNDPGEAELRIIQRLSVPWGRRFIDFFEYLTNFWIYCY